jgi:AcrR family transcriptional regulator
VVATARKVNTGQAAEGGREPAPNPGKTHRRAGRPKRDPADPDRDVREEILVAASKLFAERGYAGTGMQHIAVALDLRAPTLYHYFRQKDDILREIARSTIEDSLIYAKTLSRRSESPAQQLYKMIFEHVERLCASPYNLKGLIDVNPRQFEGLDLWREQVRQWGDRLRALVRSGVRRGEFRKIDEALTYEAVIALVGSVLRERPADLGPRPDGMAEFIATFVLRSLLTQSSRLDEICRG